LVLLTASTRRTRAVFPAQTNNIDQLIAVLDSAVSNSELNSELNSGLNSELNSELSPLSYTAAKRRAPTKSVAREFQIK